ncbi:hypothetical protein [Streptomyces mirabilis]|uniref:hypothetical protein n=1 Tax=Streptomyces mirabilis TaxID=68239 RepID=UPI0033B9C6B1
MLMRPVSTDDVAALAHVAVGVPLFGVLMARPKHVRVRGRHAGEGRLRGRRDRVDVVGEGVLREHSETFWMWPASRTKVIAEWAEYGFATLPAQADPAVLAVRLGRRCARQR